MSAQSLQVRSYDQILDLLSPRQVEVLTMLADGQNTKSIAAALGISDKTAEYHRVQLMHKLSLFNYALLTQFALRLGLITITV